MYMNAALNNQEPPRSPRTPRRNHGPERRRNTVRRHAKIKQGNYVTFRNMRNFPKKNAPVHKGRVFSQAVHVLQVFLDKFPGEDFWRVILSNGTGREMLVPTSRINHVNNRNNNNNN
jgi:hypothetical protein